MASQQPVLTMDGVRAASRVRGRVWGRGRGRRWAPRDALAAALLFLGTAATILWQNAHVVVLWDASYVLDSAVRMAQGQMPYRDFPFAHAPLTFLIQAAIIRLFGRVFFHHVLYSALAGAAGTVLAWRIALDTLRGRARGAWALALLLAAPLMVLGIYCIVPLPNYDCDCALAVLAAIWLLRRVDVRPNLWNGFAAGVAACVPLFFKQNIGLPFLAAVAGAAVWLLAMRTLGRAEGVAVERKRAPLIALLAGAVTALLAAALVLHATAGLSNYLHWTIQFAAERRLPGASAMLGVYRDPNLLWTLPCVGVGLLLLHFGKGKSSDPSDKNKDVARVGHPVWLRIGAFALLAAPFLFAFASLLRFDDADERGDSLLALWPLLLILSLALALRKLVKLGRTVDLRALTPILLLAVIHGAFLSQQLWGSTYGIWPLLMLLVAELIAFAGELWPAKTDQRAEWFAPALAALVSVTLLVCGGFYVAGEERLSYIHFPEGAQFPDGPVMHSAFPEFKGMATPGAYLPEFDELLRYAAANIPENEGLILVPGEDPFYFATGRVPRFPVLLFDPATDPYSPAQVAELACQRNIRWLIVKRDMQIKEDPTPERAATLHLLIQEFVPAAHLRGYDVYRR
jgi:hypothetical protein